MPVLGSRFCLLLLGLLMPPVSSGSGCVPLTMSGVPTPSVGKAIASMLLDL